MQDGVQRDLIFSQSIHSHLWEAQQAAGDLSSQVTHAYWTRGGENNGGRRELMDVKQTNKQMNKTTLHAKIGESTQT